MSSHQKKASFPLSQQEAAHLFKIFDVNDNGKTTLKEIHSELKKRNMNVSEDEIKEVIQVISDQDEDYLTKKPFITFMTSPRTLAGELFVQFFQGTHPNWNKNQVPLTLWSESDAMEIFGTLDSNQNGSLSKSEIRQGLKRNNVDVSDDDIDEIIRFLDASGDGEISKEEFMGYMTSKDEIMMLNAMKKLERFA